MRPSAAPARAIRAVLFLLCLTPFLRLAWDAANDNLTANPIEDLTLRTGWWTLTFLIGTLAVTPIRRITGWNRIVQYRRMFGLFGFFYACLHVSVYFGLDQLLSFDYILEDIVERPYITVGFTAWVLLIPLAITSTRRWIRRLGKRWQRLHRLAYASAVLGVLHFLWLVKADVREPVIFAIVLAMLFLLRLPIFRRRPSSTSAVRPDRPPRVILPVSAAPPPAKSAAHERMVG